MVFMCSTVQVLRHCYQQAPETVHSAHIVYNMQAQQEKALSRLVIFSTYTKVRQCISININKHFEFNSKSNEAKFCSSLHSQVQSQTAVQTRPNNYTSWFSESSNRWWAHFGWITEYQGSRVKMERHYNFALVLYTFGLVGQILPNLQSVAECGLITFNFWANFAESAYWF